MRIGKRVGVVVFLLVVTVAAIAVLSPGSSTQSTTALSSNDGFEAGMRVYLDPETGEPGAQPSAGAAIELDPELANALRHDDTGLVQVTHPNGAVSMNLEGRYAEATVVRIDENGQKIICTDNMHGLEKNLTDTTPVTPEVK